MTEPTIKQVLKMIDYLGLDSFVIPHYNMPMPKEADGAFYRSEKIFRLFKDGSMSYVGHGSINYSAGKDGRRYVSDVYIPNITPDEQWIARAYLHLMDMVRTKIQTKVEGSNMKNVGTLLLKFNELEFLNL